MRPTSATTWTPLLLWLLGFACAPDPVLTLGTIQDEWENEADADSNIQWGPLPTGQEYITDTTYKTEGLDVLFDMANGFLDIVQPNDLPYDMAVDLINGDFQIDDRKDEIREYWLGFAVCFALGLLFVIIMPIVGCCFCCCRCCDNCGGKRYQKEDRSQNCRRCGYSLILIVLTIFMGAAVVCIYVSNERMHDAVETIGDSSIDNLDDLKTFLTNTVDEIDHLATNNFNFTSKVITRDLQNIGVLLGVPVRDTINTLGGIDDVLQEVSDFEALVEVVAVDLLAVNASTHTLKENGQTLETELATISGAITTATGLVSCSPPLDCMAMGVAAGGLAMEADFDNLPDITDNADQISDVQSKDLSQMVLDGRAEFNNIPERVENETHDVVQNILDQLDDFSVTIDDELQDIQSLPADVVDDIDDVKGDIEDYSDTAKEYNQYRWYAGIGLAGIVLLVVVLQLLGVGMGLLGHSSNDAPTQRGCLSNSGGNMLMAATGFIFIFSWLLMLLTSLSFLVGGNLEKMACEPLTDPNFAIYDEIIDKPGVINDDYILGRILLDNGSTPLTIKSVLMGCKNNGAAYSVMMLSGRLDIDDVTDYSSDIDISGEIDDINVDLSTVEIMDEKTKDELRDLSDSVQLDYDGFRQELSKNTTQVDLLVFAAEVRALASSSTDPAKAALTQAAVDLEDLHAGIYYNVSEDQAQLLVDINALNISTSYIPGQVNSTLDAVQVAEDFLHTSADSTIKNESLIFADRIMATANSFANNTLNQVKNEVGRCRPVWAIYESIINVGLCQKGVDSFNGFWFGLGWAIFFMVPSIIFNVKLAKYFRRMDSADVLDQVSNNTGHGPPQYQQSAEMYKPQPPPPYGHAPPLHNNKVGHFDF